MRREERVKKKGASSKWNKMHGQLEGRASSTTRLMPMAASTDSRDKLAALRADRSGAGILSALVPFSVCLPLDLVSKPE